VRFGPAFRLTVGRTARRRRVQLGLGMAAAAVSLGGAAAVLLAVLA
jgi:hypothetical protein